jgi:hypothetical protein
VVKFLLIVLAVEIPTAAAAVAIYLLLHR